MAQVSLRKFETRVTEINGLAQGYEPGGTFNGTRPHRKILRSTDWKIVADFYDGVFEILQFDPSSQRPYNLRYLFIADDQVYEIRRDDLIKFYQSTSA